MPSFFQPRCVLKRVYCGGGLIVSQDHVVSHFEEFTTDGFSGQIEPERARTPLR